MSTTTRIVSATYQDPLDLIWIETARNIGIEIQRDSSVFAAWNGAGVLTIGSAETLDADDSLAQMVFHELCHALIEGPDAFALEDWGLSNDVAGVDEAPDANGVVHEHACLRLQAALADRFSLRTFLATTTDFRVYYDRLPADPLADGDDRAIELARAGWDRVTNGPWSRAIDSALERTAAIHEIVSGIAPENSLWAKSSG